MEGYWMLQRLERAIILENWRLLITNRVLPRFTQVSTSLIIELIINY